MLNASRPSLIKLLGEGILPFRLVGPWRRIHMEDAMAYKARIDRDAAFDKLTDDTPANGMGGTSS